MEIKIPFKTPTVNHLYGQRPGGFGRARFLKPEARKLREEIKKIIQEDIKHDPIKSPPQHLKVNVKIYEDWLCKDGSVKRKDLVNREKFLIDSVFNALGIDDKYIFEHTMEKIQSDKEFAIIKIETTTWKN